MTAVVPFKRNGLGLALCQNSCFVLREPPWFCWFGFTAGAKIQHWKQFLGQKWNISKAVDFIVLQHSVIECSLIGGVLAISVTRFLKKVLNSVKTRKKETDEDEILSS